MNLEKKNRLLPKRPCRGLQKFETRLRKTETIQNNTSLVPRDKIRLIDSSVFIRPESHQDAQFASPI